MTDTSASPVAAPAAPHSPPAQAPAPAQAPQTAHTPPSAATPAATPPGPPRDAEPKRPARIGFGRTVATMLHLAAYGVFGWAAFSVATALLGAGLGTLLLGVGAVLLIGLVYMLFGIGWFETERVAGLYGFDTPPLRLRQRQRPGFGGWLRAICRQSIDGRMWSALASFSIATVFGGLVLRFAWQFVWRLSAAIGGVPTTFGAWDVLGDLDTSLWIAPGWSLALAALALAAMYGLALLHAVIARALFGRPSRSALAAEVRTTSAQREGAVRAADLERTRIERDLHDGVQPRLVSIGMTLGLAQQKIDEDPAAAKALVAEAHTSTKAAITELRQLARGIHASVLDDRGLDAALSALAGRSHIPVHLDVRMDGRPAVDARTGDQGGAARFRDAEAAVYFSIAEALTNAAKHSRAAECRVVVRLRDAGAPNATLWARVEDNGIGGATVQPGGGLDGIANRVLAAGGEFRLDSPLGGPTALEVSVPCAS